MTIKKIKIRRQTKKEKEKIEYGINYIRTISKSNNKKIRVKKK